MPRAASALCAAILVAAAAYYPLTVIRPGAELGYGIGAYDIYAYFYPNVRYALDSLARGDGLLWNPFQDCGQPFFAFSITGLLYPVNWVFAVLSREAAHRLDDVDARKARDRDVVREAREVDLWVVGEREIAAQLGALEQKGRDLRVGACTSEGDHPVEEHALHHVARREAREALLCVDVTHERHVSPDPNHAGSLNRIAETGITRFERPCSTRVCAPPPTGLGASSRA